MSGRGDLRRTASLFRRYATGQRTVLIAGVALLAFETAAAIAVPNVLGWLLDFIKTPTNPLSFAPSRTGTIAAAAGAMVAIEALKSLSDSFAEICLAKAGRTIGYNLRAALFGHLQKLSLAFHVRRRTGDVLSRITSDVTALEEFILGSMSDLIGSVLLIVGTITVLLLRSVEVTLLALVIVPLLAFVSNFFARRIKSAAKVLRAREGELASTAQEMLGSINVVQTYGRARYEEERFAVQSGATMHAVMTTARIEAGFSFTVSVFEAVVLAGVIWIGAVVVGQPGISTGTLVAFVLMMDQMFKPTRRIIKEWNTAGKVYASVERVADLLDRKPAVTDAPDAIEAPPLRGDIEFRHVSFAYQPGPEEQSPDPTRLALDDISFTVAAGEVIALVGHSGAGKSTVAQLLPRLYDPHEGAVLLDGYDVRSLTIESLRGQISMVLQETVLFSGTIAENIAYGRETATREDVVEAAKLANAHDFVTAMPQGYDTPLGERAATLSGGQRQRLAIARAFVRDAPILILDEPTTGLDAESSELVLQALETLVRGKTAVIISHDLNLMRVADRLLVVSAGRIIEEGTEQELLARGGLYAELHARQFGEPMPAGVHAAPPISPVPDSLPALDDSRPGRHRAFETVLMQAVPLPASPEAFRLLTGHLPPAPGRPVPAPRDAASDGHADPLLAPALTRALPGLAEALDATAMAPRLAGMLADGWALEWCAPGKALVGGEPADAGAATLRYRVGLREASSGRVLEHLVGARLFPDDAAAEHWLAREVTPLAARAAGRGDLEPFARLAGHVEPLRLVLHAFPLDPDLPGLLDATDPAVLQVALGAVLSNALTGLVLEEVRPQLVQYARRGRCVLRYEVRWRLGIGGRVLKQVVYGKAYADEQGVTLGRTLEAVRGYVQAQTRPGPRFLVPRSEGYLPDLRLALLEALPGAPQVPALARQWVTGTAADRGALTLSAALDACARIAATLHECPAQVGDVRTLAGEVEAARAEVAALGGLAPDLAARLEQHLDDLGPAVTAAPLPGGFAHGDLTPAQILFDGPLSGVIDLDTACVAEPALDLGRFLGYLDLTLAKAARTSGRPAPDRAGPGRAFLDEYATAAGCTDLDLLRSRVDAFRTVTLTLLAARSFRQLKPARLQLALDVLDEQASPTVGVRA